MDRVTSYTVEPLYSGHCVGRPPAYTCMIVQQAMQWSLCRWMDYSGVDLVKASYLIKIFVTLCGHRDLLNSCRGWSWKRKRRDERGLKPGNNSIWRPRGAGGERRRGRGSGRGAATDDCGNQGRTR